MEIDLNSDMGESFSAYTIGHDAEILRYFSSANVACGWHGGDPRSMRETIRLAKEHGVAVGAHPGYPDLIGFGRRIMQITREDARNYTVYQLGALLAFAKAQGVKLQHVKPHGALYNYATTNRDVALGIAEGIAEVDPTLLYLALPGWEMEKAGREVGIPVALEAFADRAFTEDGNLASRRLPGSVISDPNEAAERVLRIVKEKRLKAITGKEIPMDVVTICLHSDTPGAGAMAKRIRERLDEAGVKVVHMVKLVK